MQLFLHLDLFDKKLGIDTYSWFGEWARSHGRLERLRVKGQDFNAQALSDQYQLVATIKSNLSAAEAALGLPARAQKGQDFIPQGRVSLLPANVDNMPCSETSTMTGRNG